MSDGGGIETLLRAHCTSLEEHAFVSLLIVDLEKATYKENEEARYRAKRQRVEKLDVSHPEMTEQQKSVFFEAMKKFIERVMTSEFSSTELIKRMAEDEDEDEGEDEDEDEYDDLYELGEHLSESPFFSQVEAAPFFISFSLSYNVLIV